MIARTIRWALILGCAAALLEGCAAGRFIVGAPQNPSQNPTQALLARRCSGCHEIPDPAAMSGEEWHASLVSMKRRMKLPASEWDSLAAMARP